MKKLLTLALILLLIPAASYGVTGSYGGTCITGGTTGCLDAIVGTNLSDGDVAFIVVSGLVYFYQLDADSGLAESSPGVISPNTGADAKRWILQDVSKSATISTLADDATPSISAGDRFLTGGTTTITDFDDGYTGKIIYVIAEHSVTITDGTNIFLAGSANFDMAATDTLTLIQKSDSYWYELGRSDN